MARYLLLKNKRFLKGFCVKEPYQQNVLFQTLQNGKGADYEIPGDSIVGQAAFWLREIQKKIPIFACSSQKRP